MKKNVLLLMGLAFMISFISCEKDNEIVKQENAQEEAVVFTTDKSEFEGRIEIINEPVVFTNKSTSEVNYTWVANMTPPVMNGVTLSASTVDGYGDFAYVGWHARGEEIYGEVSVVSIADPNAPAMIQRGTFTNQEINDLEIKENVDRLFLAGNADANMNGASIGDNAAMSMGYEMDPVTGLATSLQWQNYLPGYSANSVTYVANQTVWVSKGSQGGLTVFREYDQSNVKLDMEISNAKHFDATGDWGVLLHGVGFNESKLIVWDMTSLYAPVAEYTIPYDVTPNGKNAVDINGDFAYLAMGNDGVVKVDLTDGSVVNRFDYDNGGFCNGVTVDWRYIFAAYGADGLFIIDKDTFEVLGNWDYDGSCNYVKKVGDYLYLANGNDDGLIILKKD